MDAQITLIIGPHKAGKKVLTRALQLATANIPGFYFASYKQKRALDGSIIFRPGSLTDDIETFIGSLETEHHVRKTTINLFIIGPFIDDDIIALKRKFKKVRVVVLVAEFEQINTDLRERYKGRSTHKAVKMLHSWQIYINTIPTSAIMSLAEQNKVQILCRTEPFEAWLHNTLAFLEMSETDRKAINRNLFSKNGPAKDHVMQVTNPNVVIKLPLTLVHLPKEPEIATAV